MTQIVNVSEGHIEKYPDSWKITTFVVSGAIGLLVGLAGAFLLVQNAERKNTEQINLSPSEGIRLAVLIFGLLRQISVLHEE